MKIKYNITLKNPSEEYFNISDSYESEGSISMERKEAGYLFKGNLQSNSNYFEIHSNSYLGTRLSPSNFKEDLVLNIEKNNTSLDVVQLFDLIGKNILSDDFKKLSPFLKSTNKLTDNRYKISDYVEQASDIFVIGITEKGVVTKPEYKIEKYSCIFETTEEEYLVFYFKINRALSLETDNSVFVSDNELSKMSSGFKKIITKSYLENKSDIYLSEHGYIVESNEELDIVSNIELLFDNIESDRYNIEPYEKVLLDFKSFNEIKDNIFKDNIVLIYKLMEDFQAVPKFAISDITEEAVESEEVSIFLKSNEEFKKKYIAKIYKAILKVGEEIHQIENTSILSLLSTEFKGKIYKYE